MSVTNQNRDLLLCSIALEKNLVSAQEMEEALRLWLPDRAQPLAEVLLTGGFLSTRGHERLQTMVDETLTGAMGSISPSTIFSMLPTGIRAVLKGAQPLSDEDDSGEYQTIDSSQGPPTICFTAPPPTITVSRFHDLRPFAEGGLGEVFLAEDSQVPRTVALKQIKKRWADDDESRTRFLQEAQITGRLEHPCVVPVYALGADETGRPYYAMRFIQGHSLQQAIERFHSPSKVERQTRREWLLELRKLLDRFVDVCNAMEYAHSRDIIHRDLKPSNIMLGAYGETFVVDWGLAKVLGTPESGAPETIDPFATRFRSGSTDTKMGAALGTPAYMSPEQAAGKLDQLGPATDIYSLGVTLYQLLTGQVPHADKDVEIVFERVSHGEIVSPREQTDWAPRALASICLKAMAHRPMERYFSAREMSEDVQRWLADERVLAHEERWIEKAGRWMRQHRTLVASIVVAQTLAVGAVAAGLIAWSAYQQQQYQHKLELRQQEQQRSAELQSATDAAERAAQTEIVAGRFTAARGFLAGAVNAISEEPRMAEQRQRLRGRLEQVDRVVEYYRLAELGEERNFDQRDVEARAYIGAALTKLGIRQHGDWWAHLPEEILTAGQLDQLRQDVYHKLNLLLAEYSKDAYLYVASTKGRNNARMVVDLNDQIQRFRPSEFARWHASLSKFRLRQGSPREFSELGLPENASDAFTMSSMYAIAAQNDQVRSMVERGNENMLAKATGLLELAADMAPDHYWTHYLLGASYLLHTTQDESLDRREQIEYYKKARLALGHCIALRPDFWLGYAERSMTYQREIETIRAENPQPSPELRELIEAKIRLMTSDAQHARDVAPNAWQVYWYYGMALYTTGQVDEAVDAFQRAIDLSRTFEIDSDEHWVDTRQMTALPHGEQVANELIARHPENPRYYVLLAAAKLGQNDYDAAFTAADRAIALPDAPALAWSVRGAVHFHRQEYDAAKADFHKALIGDAENTLAAIGLAQAFEAQHDYASACDAYETAAQVSETPDGQAAGQLGRCRMLLRMHRDEGALTALIEARRVKPSCEIVTVINLAKELEAEPFKRSLADWLRSQGEGTTASKASRVVRQLPLLNGGFELGLSRYWTNAPDGGAVWSNVDGCRSRAEIDIQVKHNGNQSLHIINPSAAVGDAYGTTSQTLPADGRARYRVTLWAKAKNLSAGGLRVIVDDAWNRPVVELPVGTYGWTEISGEIDFSATAQRPRGIVPLTFRLVTTAPGEVWLDDLQIRLVEDVVAGQQN